MVRAYLLVVVFLCILHGSTGANILYFLGLSSYSQQILIVPYLDLLASNGHNVTLLTPHRSKSNNPKNYTEFIPKTLTDFVDGSIGTMNAFEIRRAKMHIPMWDDILGGGSIVCQQLIQEAEVKEWVNSASFDLVIIDSLFSDCAFGFAYKFKCPTIIFGTFPIAMWQYDTFGVPPESSSLPDMQFAYPLEMSLWQRAVTTWRVLYWHFHVRFVHHPKLESELRQALNIPDMPSLDELQRRTSLFLVNYHFSVDYSRSFPPLFVPVSGTHVFGAKTKPIETAMEEFLLDKCPQKGFVYMNFGTVGRIDLMPNEEKKILMSTFERLNDVCFFLNWETEPPANAPSNVLFRRWMPQQDILAHPQIKAFVTHGGLLGIQEGVYFSVPLIVMPLFAEQDYNAEKIIQGGYGIKLEILELSEDKLYSAIYEVLNNPTYKIEMETTSKLFRDRPDLPLDTALWWTEYVLRHGNVKGLLPYAAQQTWYQRRLLDVYLVAMVIGIICIGLITILMRKLIRAVMPVDKTQSKGAHIRKKRN